jgi:hypothetical protein
MSQRQRYFLLGIFLCLASTMLWSQNGTINLAADTVTGACIQNGVEGGKVLVHPPSSKVTFKFSGASSLTIVVANCKSNCTLKPHSGTPYAAPVPLVATTPMTYNTVNKSDGTKFCSANGDGLIMH